MLWQNRNEQERTIVGINSPTPPTKRLPSHQEGTFMAAICALGNRALPADGVRGVSSSQARLSALDQLSFNGLRSLRLSIESVNSCTHQGKRGNMIEQTTTTLAFTMPASPTRGRDHTPAKRHPPLSRTPVIRAGLDVYPWGR